MRVRFEPKSRGIESLLDEPGVEAALGRVAHQVEAAANSRGIHIGSGRNRRPVPIVVHVEVAPSRRARAVVLIAHPAGIAIEAKYGLLTGALAAVAH